MPLSRAFAAKNKSLIAAGSTVAADTCLGSWRHPLRPASRPAGIGRLNSVGNHERAPAATIGVSQCAISAR
jgi:hypothetical protein